MNAQDIVSIINSVGFPIVACAALFWLLNKTVKENTAANAELAKRMQEVSATIGKLDETLGRIESKLETVKDEVHEVSSQ